MISHAPIYKAVIQFVRSGAWCKGSTPAFGAVDLGSNPGAPANVPLRRGFFSTAVA